MIKRMLEPSLILLSLLTMAFSFGAAHVLVNGLHWRYTDPLGLIDKPFDESMSILAFAVNGFVFWPIAIGMFMLMGHHAYFNVKRKMRRQKRNIQ